MAQQVLVLADDGFFASLQSHAMAGGALNFVQAKSLPGLLELLKEPWDSLLVSLEAVAGPPKQFFRQVSAATSVPIVAVTDEADTDTVVNVLDWGADECLDTQLSPREIVTHLRAQIRRATEYSQLPDQKTELTVGLLRVDIARHQVSLDGEALQLTPREFDLLAFLARNAGRAVPREEIIEQVWSGAIAADSRSLDVHIGRLRAKIEDDPSKPVLLTTVTGFGYRLEAQ